ncbi:MAG TPA: carbon-nitrogen hydrolase family protein [Verrucomicrobiae bacterium]|nr:carbon-nitrogen hydrolase family protein [Verrucomicrobiae bacterium]
MSRLLAIAAVQREPVPAASDRWERVAAQVREVLGRFPATQFVVLPEYHAHLLAGAGVAYPEHMEAVAESIPGPGSTAMAALARELGIWLIPGSQYERGADGHLYNTAVVASPAGEIVATYRKCFPWRPFETTSPGTTFTVFDVPAVGRVGLSIGYDSWFPEVARHLAWLGAEIIIQPTCTTTSDREQELVLARATAIVNQLYVVSVNTAMPPGTGHSIIVDPEGHVRQEAGEGPLVMTDVLDLAATAQVRERGTCGVDRVWSHFRVGDPDLPLPLYGGRIRAEQWAPRRVGDNDGAHRSHEHQAG